MNSRQQKDRLRTLQLKDDARKFRQAVLIQPQPALLLFKFATNSKLRQFNTNGLFDSSFQLRLYSRLSKLPIAELESLSQNVDVCELVFPRSSNALNSFLSSPHRILLPFLGVSNKSAFYLGRDTAASFFIRLKEAQFTPDELDAIPDLFWNTLKKHSALHSAMVTHSPHLLPVFERRTLLFKYNTLCLDEPHMDVL